MDAAEAEMETSSLSVTGSVVLAAGLLGLTALANPATVAFALAVAMVVIAWGWAGTLALPTPRGTVWVLVFGGLTILASLTLPGGRDSLNWLPGALAISIITAFLHQLLRRDGRPRVAESVSSVLLALTLFTCSAFIVPLARTPQGVSLVVAAMGAAIVSALAATAMRRLGAQWAPWVVPLALLLGAIAGSAVAGWGALSWAAYVVVGVLAAAVSHTVRFVFSTLPTMAHRRPRVVVALCSVLAIGVVPYAVALAMAPSVLSW